MSSNLDVQDVPSSLTMSNDIDDAKKYHNLSRLRRLSSQFSDRNLNDKEDEFHQVYSHAKRFIVPSWGTQLLYKIYAKRTLLIPFAFHFIATMIIWRKYENDYY